MRAPARVLQRAGLFCYARQVQEPAPLLKYPLEPSVWFLSQRGPGRVFFSGLDQPSRPSNSRKPKRLTSA